MDAQKMNQRWENSHCLTMLRYNLDTDTGSRTTEWREVSNDEVMNYAVRGYLMGYFLGKHDKNMPKGLKTAGEILNFMEENGLELDRETVSQINWQESF